MTVQDLINKLQRVTNRNLKVCVKINDEQTNKQIDINDIEEAKFLFLLDSKNGTNKT